MRVLVIAPPVLGLGETIIARQIANSLDRRSHEVCIVTAATSSFLFAGDRRFTVYEIVPIPELHPLNVLTLRSVVETFEPDVVLVSDYFTGGHLLARYGIDLSVEIQAPTFYIDLYDWPSSGHVIDMFDGQQMEVPSLHSATTPILQPSPLLSPFNPMSGVVRYNGLFGVQGLSAKQRAFIHHSMGLARQDRLILVVTSRWQHVLLEEHPQALAPMRSMIESVARAVPHAVLVHIGPRAIDDLKHEGLRYLWFPQMQEDRFDTILGAADLFVTQNVIATTLTKAIEIGVPCMHFFSPPPPLPPPREEADGGGSAAATAYHVWPLGWYRFIDRILVDNPMLSVVRAVDVNDRTASTEAIRSLLEAQHDPSAKLRRAEYLAAVRNLPDVADVLSSHFS